MPTSTNTHTDAAAEVRCVLTLEGIDYDALASNSTSTSTFKSTIATTLAALVGFTEPDIVVVLSKGSVIVEAILTSSSLGDSHSNACAVSTAVEAVVDDGSLAAWVLLALSNSADHFQFAIVGTLSIGNVFLLPSGHTVTASSCQQPLGFVFLSNLFWWEWWLVGLACACITLCCIATLFWCCTFETRQIVCDVDVGSEDVSTKPTVRVVSYGDAALHGGEVKASRKSYRGSISV